MKKTYLFTLLGVGMLALSGCAGGKTTPCCDRLRDEYKPVVHFAFDSAALTSEDKRILQQVPEKIKDCPEVVIDVTGYTDNLGTSAYNQQLGKMRAQSVQAYLMGLGVTGHRFRVMSMGEHDPAACNSTEEGRIQNRRAVIEFK